MGTRCLTVIKDSRELCVMYRPFDGYVDGHGYKLAGFLSGFSIVNGLNVGQGEKVANGAPCLAAQVVSHFKSEAGGFYLYPSGTRDCGEDYLYVVTAEVGKPINISVTTYGREIFSGTPEDLLKFQEPEED
jgi:hypothetical protein